ncbi:hypothetical protein ACFLYE_01170 [Chloroflexota bacterium]
MSKGLGKQQYAILNVLSKSEKGFFAFEILKELKPSAVQIHYDLGGYNVDSAALWSVYRALNSLHRRGLITKSKYVGIPLCWELISVEKLSSTLNTSALEQTNVRQPVGVADRHKTG